MSTATPFQTRPTDPFPSFPVSRRSAAAARRRTRIVCTLGPACEDRRVLSEMTAAGMDVARFNFSHGSHDCHRRLIGEVRLVAAEHGRRVDLMQDLQGPKLRIGALPGGALDLAEGDAIELRSGCEPAGQACIPVPHPALVHALQPGDRVLFGDGEIEVRVRSLGDENAVCDVVRGGALSERKGITVPGRHFAIPILTKKDVADLVFGQSLEFDFLALSFVRTADDVQGARRLCRELDWNVPLVAKLETQEALWNLDAILAVCDAVMVARGDLGVQLPLAEVPAAQKEIISSANQAGVPVITATQMLESMIASGRPTRAEATDVANAIWDGTDAVMLSGETSAGRNPVEAVRAMSELCVAAERKGCWRRGAGAGWPDLNVHRTERARVEVGTR
jgi:pyruvate kinase